MRGLQDLAARARCGVLAVAHDTKTSRDEAKMGR